MALPKMANDKRLKNIQWKLQEQRQRLHENVLLRKSMLEANYARQLAAEKNDIISRIARLQPGPQKTFLKMRLGKIK